MKLYQIGTCAAIGAALVLGFQNCAKQGDLASSSLGSADSVEMQKTMSSLRGQLNALGARDLTCEADADCVAVPVGGAHCGSPTFYVQGSAKSADYPHLLDLATEFRDVERNFMSANQLVGSCVVRPQPRATCQENRCVTSLAP